MADRRDRGFVKGGHLHVQVFHLFIDHTDCLSVY